MIVSLSVAMGYNGVIGRQDGSLPWPPSAVPGELPLFQKTTQFRPVVMGRKTWDSLPRTRRPLRGRVNHVLSRCDEWHPVCPRDSLLRTSIERAGSLEDLLTELRMRDVPEVVVIGGADVFAQAYPHADRVYLTLVDGAWDGEVYFPRTILSDACWAWDPVAERRRGWTRHILTRKVPQPSPG